MSVRGNSKNKESGVARPMLAALYEEYKGRVDWDACLAQPRIDGVRCLARRQGKKVILTCAENQRLSALHEIEEVLRAALVEGVILDGAIYKHGLSLSRLSSACKKRNDLSAKLEYHVYDMVSTEEFASRIYQAERIVFDAGSDNLVATRTILVRAESELMICQKEFLEAGYAGAMLRHGCAGYEAGKRSFSLLKLKVWLDSEFRVVDYKLGRGKYAGIPIFTCETEAGNHFDVLAPGTSEEKRALGGKARECVGKLLTVTYAYYTKTAEPVPFLPVALRFKE
jgi:ATP-dependent DNA ligase